MSQTLNAQLGSPRTSQLGDPQWLGAVLDELDYGLLVVDAKATLLHANRRARQQLNCQQALQLQDGQVRARWAADAAALELALSGARLQGRRRLLTLGDTEQPQTLAVVPLGAVPPCSLTLLMLGRSQLGDPSTLQGFAHDHGLTPSEARVLEHLSWGLDPDAIAQQLSVGISTVRTHIGALREKTRCSSIRALLHRVAGLPPLAPRLPC